VSSPRGSTAAIADLQTACHSCGCHAAAPPAPRPGVEHRLRWLRRKVERAEHLSDEEVDWLVAHHPAFVPER